MRGPPTARTRPPLRISQMRWCQGCSQATLKQEEAVVTRKATFMHVLVHTYVRPQIIFDSFHVGLQLLCFRSQRFQA